MTKAQTVQGVLIGAGDGSGRGGFEVPKVSFSTLRHYPTVVRPRDESSFESEMKFARVLPNGVVYRLTLSRRR